MRRGRNLVLCLLAALLVVGCGLLPGAAAMLTDRYTVRQPRLSPVENLEFALIPGPDTEPALSIATKLWIVAAPYGLDVPASYMVSTEEQILSRAMGFLNGLYDLGAVSWEAGRFPGGSVQPMVYSRTDGNTAKRVLVWKVLLERDSPTAPSVEMIVDDQTGLVMSFYYASPEKHEGQDDGIMLSEIVMGFTQGLNLEIIGVSDAPQDGYGTDVFVLYRCAEGGAVCADSDAAFSIHYRLGGTGEYVCAILPG